jgi:hypothetical protein
MSYYFLQLFVFALVILRLCRNDIVCCFYFQFLYFVSSLLGVSSPLCQLSKSGFKYDLITIVFV